MLPLNDNPLVAGQNAAADVFADLLFGQGGEPAEAQQSRHSLFPSQDLYSCPEGGENVKVPSLGVISEGSAN